MKSVFFFPPWNHYHLPKNFPNGLVAWHISKPVPGGERLGNPMGNTFSMDTTWEHRWKMVKNKDRHQAKGHIFEAGIPFLWHSNFDWDITIWTTCSSFLLIESWLPYIFGRHFRKHGTISSSGFDWATIPERRQDFRSPYTHFTYGPWTINVFNRQSTVTQYESFIDVIYIYIFK